MWYKVHMGTKGRGVLTTKHKVVLWIVALVLLWEVLQSNTILEALLTFGMAGVVPGTHIVLSPDMVILVSGIFLGLLLLGIALRMLLRRPKDRVPLHPEVIAVPVQASATAPVDPHIGLAPVVSQHTQKRKGGALGIVPTQVLKLLSPVRRAVSHVLRIVLTGLDRHAPAAKQALLKCAHTVWAVGVIVIVFVRSISIRAFVWARDKIAQGWRWLVPYLWKFDEWLELQVRAFTKWARKKSYEYHSLVVIISMYRQYKKWFSESPFAAWSQTFKRQSSREQD